MPFLYAAKIMVDREGIEPNRLATQHIKATDLQSAVGNTVHVFLVGAQRIELWLIG